MTDHPEHRTKALVFLSAADGDAAASTAADQMAATITARADGRAEVDIAHRLGKDPLLGAFGADKPLVRAVIEVSAPAAGGIEVLREVLDQVVADHPAIDPATSTVVAGAEHVIRDGRTGQKLYFLMRARTDLTLAQFHDYWRNVHAVHHAHVEGIPGYRQLHADPTLSAELTRHAGAAAPSYDGVAETFFESVGGLGNGRPEGRGDRVNFVDPATEFAVVTTVGPTP